MLEFTGRPLRILDFDAESRPLSFLGSDFTTDEITAIAFGWVGGKSIRCYAIGVKCQHPGCAEYHNGCSTREMLVAFRKAYDAADMVTGHYIRGFDLPLLNGMMLEEGLPPLQSKLSQDTKNDLKKRKGVSVSQENLGVMLHLEAPKIQMNTPYWREANRLSPAGIRRTRKRVIGDVRQHMQLRQSLLDGGWLNRPQVWRSSGSLPEYQP